MARYSRFKYNSGTKYGVSIDPGETPETGDLIWVFSVDWDEDGKYDPDNEAAWLVDMRMRRGRTNYLDPGGGGFEHPRADTLSLIFDDPDRRYDPRNENSPLYPNVYPGKNCLLRVVMREDGTSYKRFTGYIDSIKPNTREKRVTMECKGFLQVLADHELSTDTARIGVTIDEALTALLTDVNYPGPMALDSTNQPVHSFAINRQRAAQVAAQLADASLGVFFNDVEGRACYYGRDHGYGVVHELSESDCLKEIQITQPWEDVYKQTTVIYRHIVRDLQSTIFYLSNPIEVTKDEPLEIYPSYRSSTDVQLKLLKANTQENGEGTDISASMDLQESSFGPTAGYLRIVPGADGWITKLEIVGNQMTETEERFEQNTGGAYDRRFVLDSPWMQDRNFALGFSSILQDFLKDDRESLVIQIETRPETQFPIDVMHVVEFKSDTFAIDDTYWVLGLDEEWLSPTGQGVLTTFYLHKILTNDDEFTPAPMDVENPVPPDYNKPGKNKPPPGGGGDLPEGTFYSRACSVYGSVMPPSNVVSDFMTFTVEVSDPDNMITAPSTDITVPDEGQYFVMATGRYYAVAGYSSSADETGACGITLSVRVYKNGVLQTSNAGVASSRFAHQGVTWQAYANPVTATMLDLVGNDVIKIEYVTNMFGTPDTGVTTRAVMVFCSLYKIRGS